MSSYFIKLLEGACHIQILVLLRVGYMELSFTHT